MTAEMGSSSAGSEERSNRFPRWLVVLAAFLEVLVVVGAIIAWPKWFGFAERKPWNYLDVFLVPVAVAGATVWLTLAQDKRQHEAEEEQDRRRREDEIIRRQIELDVEEQRAQDEALEAYLDEISQLLTDEKRPLSRARPGDNLSTVTRARTLTALTRLDGYRKRSVLQFLYESGLVIKARVVVDLKGADLSAANLSAANLSSVNLSEADLRSARLNAADLRGDDLSEAALIEADLSSTNLYKADLSGADLLRGDLSAANLSEADLSEAHLIGTNLHKVNLRRGDLRRAFLRAAHLHEAELQGAHLEEANLQGAHLEEAIMTNGQKYEEWLNDKEGSGENGENSGSS
jgi:uncharacterized protein YjbI with pentapeptide repeats